MRASGLSLHMEHLTFGWLAVQCTAGVCAQCNKLKASACAEHASADATGTLPCKRLDPVRQVPDFSLQRDLGDLQSSVSQRTTCCQAAAGCQWHSSSGPGRGHAPGGAAL